MFSESLVREIRRLCEEAYPDEACGLVVGPGHTGSETPVSGKGGDRVVQCSNIQDRLHAASPVEHPETSREAYAMDPDELRGIADEMEARGEVMKAIYHSHTDCEASLSRRDIDLATHAPGYQEARRADSAGRNGVGGGETHGREPMYRGVLYLVIEVWAGRAGGLRCYRWDDVTGDFAEAGDSGEF